MIRLKRVYDPAGKALVYSSRDREHNNAVALKEHLEACLNGRDSQAAEGRAA
jgi:uncharacterized protein YeaO (DUF488 family)